MSTFSNFLESVLGNPMTSCHWQLNFSNLNQIDAGRSDPNCSQHSSLPGFSGQISVLNDITRKSQICQKIQNLAISDNLVFCFHLCLKCVQIYAKLFPRTWNIQNTKKAGHSWISTPWERIYCALFSATYFGQKSRNFIFIKIFNYLSRRLDNYRPDIL